MLQPSISKPGQSLFLSACFFFVMMSCSSKKTSEDPEQWSDQQAAEWFDQKEWLGQTQLQPDPSIDRKDLALRYHEHKDRWDKAFEFLGREDLDSIAVGTHEIDGKNVYAIVQEYTSKNPEDAKYESHRHYTDVQHIISGTEAIGLAELANASVMTPYDEEKDIAFYTASGGKKLIAKPGNFFIFFPDDAHMPGMKVDENAPVKKVVIKVKND